MVTWYWIESSISKECNNTNTIITTPRAMVFVLLHSINAFRTVIEIYLHRLLLLLFFLINCSLEKQWLILVVYKTNNECFYSCNGKNIFIRLVEYRTFHLSPHENILTIALINIHYLHVYCNIWIPVENIFHKHIPTLHASIISYKWDNL
jgi:hypothetical protein